MNQMQAKNPDFEDRVRASFGRQPFMGHIGAELTILRPGYCEIDLPYRKALTQQHGFIHGGAMATIADCAAGYAAFSLMPADSSVLTVEYKLNIVRPGEGEKLIARAQVIKPGRTLTVVNSDVFAIKDGVETLCVTSLQTLMALPGRPDEPAA
ncbi:MAG: PaaI family thioesterase [Alphaproteobacteria bacterium]